MYSFSLDDCNALTVISDALVHRQCDRDATDVRTSTVASRSASATSSPQWCCDKHRVDVETSRNRMIEERRLTNVCAVRERLRRLDAHKDGFVSRELLRLLAQKAAADGGHQGNFTPAALERLLDSCLMGVEEQRMRRAWEEGASERGTGIPIAGEQYSQVVFAQLLADEIAELDRKRFIS